MGDENDVVNTEDGSEELVDRDVELIDGDFSFESYKEKEQEKSILREVIQDNENK